VGPAERPDVGLAAGPLHGQHTRAVVDARRRHRRPAGHAFHHEHRGHTQ
jgi:hypothetical protein